MRQWWALGITLAGAVLLAILATTPPSGVGIDSPADRFAAERAMADVRAIARAPHPTGSAENARVRNYLVQRLAAMGLAVRTASAPLDAKSVAVLRRWSGRTDPAPPVVNVVARLPGTDPRQPAVLLMAHYDSVWGSPGAADDAAGVASILEVVRAIRAAPRTRDLVVLFSDGEELGLQGARAFFARDPLARRVGVVVNLEARGGGGRASMFETGDANGALMALFGAAVRRPVGTSLSVFVYRHLPNSTDFTPAREAGAPGFNFAFIGRSGLYHSPLATADALDRGSVQDMGGQVLDLTRALLAAPTLPGRAADVTFFDAFGLALVRYPAGWGRAIVASGVLLYAAATWRSRDWRGVGLGALATVALVLVSAALLYGVNVVSGAGSGANYYDRLAAIPRLQVQALLLCVAALTGVWAWIAQRRPAPAGWALPVALLAIGAQALAPTAAFLLAWPLLLGGGGSAVRAFGGAAAGRVAEVMAGAIGGGYLLAIGFFLLQGVGPGLPMVAALPLALAALLVWPLMPRVETRQATITSLALVLAATGIALWVRLDPIAPSVPPYSDTKK